MTDNWESEYIKKIYSQNRGHKPQRAAAPEPPHDDGKKPIGTFFVASLIFLVTFSAFLGFTLAIFSKFMLFETLLTLIPGEKLLGETNILVLGVDSEGAVKRSDTIMVTHIDPTDNSIGVVSIPRDTRVLIEGRGEDKINHAFAFGGPDLSRRTAEKFLGINIPYYVAIDFSGVRHLIDDIGGVEINVEKRMYYVDHSQNLFVDLYPGRQKLNGYNALAYLRYRKDGGDVTRILRQQNFMKSLASQITNKENILNSPKILLKLFSLMDSNLNTKEILGLAINMRKIYNYGQIKMTAIEGADEMLNGVYYMKPDPEKIKETVNNYLKEKPGRKSLETRD